MSDYDKLKAIVPDDLQRVKVSRFIIEFQTKWETSLRGARRVFFILGFVVGLLFTFLVRTFGS